MKRTRFPSGWNEKRVQAVIDHYENQTEDEAVAEDEAAFSDPSSTVMVIPHELVPAVLKLLAKYDAENKSMPKPKATPKKRNRLIRE